MVPLGVSTNIYIYINRRDTVYKNTLRMLFINIFIIVYMDFMLIVNMHNHI